MKEVVLNFLLIILISAFIAASITGGISEMCEDRYYSCLEGCELEIEEGSSSSYCSKKCKKISIYYETDYQTCYDTCKDLIYKGCEEKCKRDLEANQGLLRILTIILTIYFIYIILKG
jgi:hypothetical protein